jgi:hypothetical protein
MIKRFGDDAPIESGKRADELADAGDDAGAAIWTGWIGGYSVPLPKYSSPAPL